MGPLGEAQVTTPRDEVSSSAWGPSPMTRIEMVALLTCVATGIGGAAWAGSAFGLVGYVAGFLLGVVALPGERPP